MWCWALKPFEGPTCFSKPKHSCSAHIPQRISFVCLWLETYKKNAGKCSSVYQVDRLQIHNGRSKKAKSVMCWVLFNLCLSLMSLQNRRQTSTIASCKLSYIPASAWALARECYHEEWAGSESGHRSYFILFPCLPGISVVTALHNVHNCYPDDLKFPVLFKIWR